MAKKPSGKKGGKQDKEIKQKIKGPKPDYKIPKIGKDVFKEVYPDLEGARKQLIAAPKKDKWIYNITYKVLKEQKYNGGVMVIKHNSKK